MDEQLLCNPESNVTTKPPCKVKKRHSLMLENRSYYDEIHMNTTVRSRNSSSGHSNPTPELTTYGGIKLGWIQGVLIPCLLNIWGVMLFLRISWVVGQAGIGMTLVIILLTGAVCVITTLSLSAICTNGELQGGGLYYLVSRSLGAEFGALVGIIFAFANSVAASMNTIGFCDSLNELLKDHNLKIIDNGINDVRIVGAVALLIMCIICAIGMDWETKTQNFLIVIIILAILNFIIGGCIGPTQDVHIARGFVGMNLETAQRNWLPDFRYSEGVHHDFFSIFAMFFPAMTGVQAGANICGDLKDPARAIPKGTLLALTIAICSYVLMTLMSGMGVLRDASGDPSNLTYNALENCKPNCQFGLHNNYDVMKLMALWGPLVYCGCWAATLSTALTNLLSVPRLIQALGVDRIYPGLIFFSKPYGKHGEPYRGYALTFLVSVLFLLIAELNTIAPLITNFYLASYALINFCTFHAALIQQISWRPTFQLYNKWLSLVGFLMCVAMMVIMSWLMALITTSLFITLYLLVLYTKPEASWGSSTDAHRYQETVASILHISRRAEHIKSYNPQVLVMAGKPYTRPVLLELANLFTRMGSFMIVADVEYKPLTYNEKIKRINLGEDWLQSGKFRAFYVLLNGFQIDEGMTVLAQTVGLGRFVPNIVVLGYQNSWSKCSHDKLNCYVRSIKNAFEERLAVVIFRISKNQSEHDAFNSALNLQQVKSSRSSATVHSEMLLSSLMNSNSDVDIECAKLSDEDKERSISTSNVLSKEDSFPKCFNAFKHQLKFESDAPLDVWWLYDDGGLNILLPYIIARRSNKKMPLRIFAFTKHGHRDDVTREQMKTLLARFRIDYTELIIVNDIGDTPSEASWDKLNSFMENYRRNSADELFITQEEVKLHDLKIRRYLRLRELLIEHSLKSALIVMSLPKPRKNISHAMYMTWLEVLSDDLPPMIFVRGNSTAVLNALYG